MGAAYKKISWFLLVAYGTLLVLSCSDQTYCEQEVIGYLKINFYSQNEEGNFVKTATDSFSVRGLLNDSMIYRLRNNISTIELPLSNLSDTSHFLFTFNLEEMHINTLIRIDTLPVPADTIILDTVVTIDTSFTYRPVLDTVQIIYKRNLQLISPVCGFGYNYELFHVYSSRNYMDSMRIVYPFVILNDNNDAENIRMFY